MARNRRRGKNNKGKKEESSLGLDIPEPTAFEIDPHYYEQLYLAETPSTAHPGTYGLNYDQLYSMSRLPVIGAIIQTRIQQIAEFAVPQSSPYGSGFRVTLRDPSQKSSKATDRMSREIEDMILQAGGKYGQGGFEAFVRALMRDSLTYDQANFEVLRSRGGRPVGFVAVDAATVRRAKPKSADADRGRRTLFDEKEASYVQMIHGKVVADFRHEEMGWGIRRPRTALWVNGYGYPELEELMKVITDLANAQTYNSVNFTNGVHTSTILALKSNMTAQTFRSFKRQVMSMMTGVANAKRTPIVQLDPERKEEIQAVNLSQTNKDMEYMQFVGFLMKLTCAVFSMDAAELGFVFGTENQQASLSQGGPAQRIVASKERGLRPVLRSLQQWLNNYFVYPYHEDFQLEFVGLDSVSEQDKIEMDLKAIRNFKTINEIRQEHDLKPLDSPLADMILDPTYMNSAFAMLQEEKMAEQGGPEGMDPEGMMPEGMMPEEMEGGPEMEGGQEGDQPMFEFDGQDDQPDFSGEQGMDLLTQALVGKAEESIGSGSLTPLTALKKGAKKQLRYRDNKAFVVEV